MNVGFEIEILTVRGLPRGLYFLGWSDGLMLVIEF